jgi:drug/metabolite transporter (DMT)-like permease
MTQTQTSPPHHGKALEERESVTTIEDQEQTSIGWGNLMKLPINQAAGGSTFEVFGFDISYFHPEYQYLACLIGFLSFSLCYGYLQELLSVHVFSRKMTLFLSTVQFTGYAVFCSLLMRTVSTPEGLVAEISSKHPATKRKEVPPRQYITLALLRAGELGLTNLSLAYLNFPAKTLLKSSRVVSTMLAGSWLRQKSYRMEDIATVVCMVLGLFVFLNADANSDTIVFHWFGVLLLVISNLLDGVIVTISEGIMKEYNVPQDEFIFQVYYLAALTVGIVAGMAGELDEGILWMSTPGTYQEFLLDDVASSWSIPGKWAVVLLFGLSGYIALYFSQTVIKHFGALTMSITNTCRRATALFLSFVLFHNVLTAAHLLGLSMFAVGLFGKVLLQFSTGSQAAQYSWLKTPTMKRKISGIPSANTGKDTGMRQEETDSDLDLSQRLPMHRTRRSADAKFKLKEKALSHENV